MKRLVRALSLTAAIGMSRWTVEAHDVLGLCWNLVIVLAAIYLCYSALGGPPTTGAGVRSDR